jgi:signal transduction histidine kinase
MGFIAIALSLSGWGQGERMHWIALGATVVSSALVCVALIVLALRPSRELHAALDRFARGEESARVQPSRWADDEERATADLVNSLLEATAEHHVKTRAVADRLMKESDAERYELSVALSESTAQTLAAVLLEVRAAAIQASDAAIERRLEAIREVATRALEEIRSVSQDVYPRVVTDLGLASAIRELVRAQDAGVLRVSLEIDPSIDAASGTAATLLYQVAKDALQRASRAPGPRHVRVEAGVVGAHLALDVLEEGPLVDEAGEPDAFDRRVRHRVELTGGSYTRLTQGDRRMTTLRLPQNGYAA